MNPLHSEPTKQYSLSFPISILQKPELHLCVLICLNVKAEVRDGKDGRQFYLQTRVEVGKSEVAAKAETGGNKRRRRKSASMGRRGKGGRDKTVRSNIS